MAGISRKRLAKTIVRLLQEQPTNRPKILLSAAAYLIEHKQAHQLDLLLSDIAAELQTSTDYLFATVQTAYQLDDATRQQLSQYLQARTGAKTVELHEQIDPSLLSGVIVRTADMQLDTSARSKLRKLARLNSAER